MLGSSISNHKKANQKRKKQLLHHYHTLLNILIQHFYQFKISLSSKKKSYSSFLTEPFFHFKRAPLHIKETPFSNQGKHLFPFPKQYHGNQAIISL